MNAQPTDPSPSSPPLFGGRAAAELFAVSFLALFLELALIRWIPGCVKVIGYFTNLVLISSFLGIGLGCAAPADPQTESRAFNRFPLRLLICLAIYALVQHIGMFPMPQFWGERIWDFGKTGIIPPFLMPELVFILNTWLFIPTGRVLGAAMGRFKPITGYSINLAGSLAGTLALSVMSALIAPPMAWFAVIAAAALFLIIGRRPPKKTTAIAAAVLAACLAAVLLPSRGKIWSPYYKINVGSAGGLLVKAGMPKEWTEKLGLTFLSVNDDYFQFAVNLNPALLEQFSRETPEQVSVKITSLADYVNLPYRLRPPGRVLILGAGMGNDAAAALRNGELEIDAVEIDPVIIKLGRALHPEKPYADPRVTVFNTDARRFLRRSENKYELVVYAFLDSHTLFSAFSSVRLDTFVYTQDSFREAARLLAPDGVMVVMFAASRDFVGRRLFHMVHDIYPDTARVWAFTGGPWGAELDIIAAGPGLDVHNAHPGLALRDVTEEYFKTERPDIPTDNWPFLYLESKMFSPAYAATLAALFIIAAIFTRKVIGGGKRLHLHFFLLGAGFLLLQTKSITELSLLFGSTWIVNSAVITSFLLMALLANLYVIKAPMPPMKAVYLLLAASLAAAYFIPIQSLFTASPMLSGALGGGLAALPVFFSGIIFASSFKGEAEPARALGSNILGAVAGGLFEYVSLMTGFKALYIFALAFYLGAYLSRRK